MTSTARSRLASGGGTGGMADRIFRTGTGLLGVAIIAILLALAMMLAVNGAEAFQTFGLGFVTSTDWDAVRDLYGAFPFIVGTLLSALIALVIAAPIGLLTAIFLAELAPRRIAIPLTFAIELLAAIPSVV